MGNDSQTEGKFEQVRGDIKENVGDAIGNEQMENEGKLDQAKGNVREGVGDVQEGVERTADNWNRDR